MSTLLLAALCCLLVRSPPGLAGNATLLITRTASSSNWDQQTTVDGRPETSTASALAHRTTRLLITGPTATVKAMSHVPSTGSGGDMATSSTAAATDRMSYSTPLKDTETRTASVSESSSRNSEASPISHVIEMSTGTSSQDVEPVSESSSPVSMASTIGHVTQMSNSTPPSDVDNVSESFVHVSVASHAVRFSDSTSPRTLSVSESSSRTSEASPISHVIQVSNGTSSKDADPVSEASSRVSMANKASRVALLSDRIVPFDVAPKAPPVSQSSSRTLVTTSHVTLSTVASKGRHMPIKNNQTTDHRIPQVSRHPRNASASEKPQPGKLRAKRGSISAKLYAKIHFVMSGIVIPVIALFGVCGNVLSITVLSQTNTAIFKWLIGLGVADTMYLISRFIMCVLLWVRSYDTELAAYFTVAIQQPVGILSTLVSIHASNWIIVFLTLERFTAVKFPLRAKTSVLERFPSVTIVCIFLLFIAFFIPMMFTYRRAEIMDKGLNITLPVLLPTPFYYSREKMIYAYFSFVAFRVVPIIAVLVLNALILHSLHKRERHRKQLTTLSKWHEHRQVTRMLLVVSAVFLIFMLPRSLLGFASLISTKFVFNGAEHYLFFTMLDFSHACESINSSVNFLIYFVMSSKFKITYNKIFSCKKGSAQTKESTTSTVDIVTHL